MLRVNRYIAAFVCLFSLSLATPAQEPSEGSLAPNEQDEMAQLHNQFAAATAALRQAAAAIAAVQKVEDAHVAAAELDKAFAAFDDFYARYVKLRAADDLTEQEMSAWDEAVNQVSDAWGTTLIQRLSTKAMECDELVYQLFIRRSPIVNELLQKNDIMESWLCIYPMEAAQNSPALQKEQAAWRDSAKARHAAFMAEHQDTFTGGNGADSDSAICLPDGKDQEEQALIIAPYMQSVYPDVDSCYVGMQASPNGAFYKVYGIYKGLFRDTDGKLRLRVLPVWFRVNSLRNRTSE